MTIPGRRFAQAIALTILGALGWLGGCSDLGPRDPATPPEGLVVSDPVLVAGSSARVGTASALASAGDEVAYVSLAPGTVPPGNWATIRRVGDAGWIVTALLGGGFDPVAVNAGAGDSIDVIVRDAGGGTVLHTRLAVAAVRPPIVVRTNPPRKKTDVPLNSAIVIVFSEPVQGSSLTPTSVRLLRGTTPVAGTVSLLQGTGAAAAFTPAAPLAANTQYRLEVTQVVQDFEGDALAAGVTVAFTTGQSFTGPAASITVSPDTVTIMTGATYQMTATVRDAAGNELIEQPVAWSTSDSSGLSISPAGLLTALAAGSYAVTAKVNGLTASAGVNVSAGPPASVTVSPTSATVAALDTIFLIATVRDAAGVPTYDSPVMWTSSAPAVATITPTGSAVAVTGVSPGSVTITATSATASGMADVTVIPPVPVASVTVTPASGTMVPQATRLLSATLRDSNDRVIGGRPIAWASDNATVAMVDGSGLVTGLSLGSTAVVAASGGVSDTAVITVAAPITLGSVSAGLAHSCGVTPTGAAYCWGANASGTLGDGSTTSSLVPVAVTGGLTFSAVTAGEFHTCGLSSNGAAYCWGSNDHGQLGNGSSAAFSSAPVAVAGGLTFSAVSAGVDHTCGVSVSGLAYCWGWGSYAQVGDGSRTDSPVPMAVTGGLTFSAVSAGFTHTCAVTTDGHAYCWGLNNAGQLGNGSFGQDSISAAPVAVTGGLTFSAVSAGDHFNTCGLATTGTPYCWGEGQHTVVDEQGPHVLAFSPVPVPVINGLDPRQFPPTLIIAGPFSTVSAGFSHTCWLSPAGGAYCAGSNYYGQRGDGGDATPSGRPLAVAGGLTFSAVSAGTYHTCGVTVAGIAYCWGLNAGGELGDGSTTNSNVPVKVVGPP